jgi:Sulfate permease family
MVEGSGGRSQLAHLATAGVVALVLVFLTGPLQYLAQCVLGAIIFTIAVGLVELRGLRNILRESPGEFRLALGHRGGGVHRRRVLVHAQSSLQADLDRHRLTAVIGADHVIETLHEALAMIRGQRVPAGPN